MILTRKNQQTPDGYVTGKILHNRKISIVIGDETFDLLKRQCELTGLSMAEVIRQFLPNMGR